MNPEFIEEMRQILLAEKKKILGLASKVRSEMVLDTDDLPDEMDQASSEYNQGIALRLRGREKRLLDKIEEALARIEDEEFGICDDCGEDIGQARLRARPVATFCIQCKEEQERREKSFG